MKWTEYLKKSKTYKVHYENGRPYIEAYKHRWPYISPLSLELTAYRQNLDGNALYHMKKAHNFVWPKDIKTWNYWTERRFAAHCEGWKIITMAGGANALPLEEIVYTPNGTTKIKDLKVGDEICDPHGSTQKVTALLPIKTLPYYRVHLNDGTFVDCCEEHLWSVKTKYDIVYNRPYRIVPAKELKKLINHRVYLPELAPVHFNPQSVEMDPYILGLYLGDGNFTQGTPRLSLTEKKDAVRKYLVNTGSSASPYKQRPNKNNRESRISLKEYADALTNLGLKNVLGSEKFIPKTYIHNSIEVRSKTLAGLLDTDGSCISTTAYCYSTTSEKLSNDVSELARSLGIRATIKKYLRPGPRKPLYKVTLADFPKAIQLPLRRLSQATSTIRKRRRIIDVTPTEKQTGRCISVSNDDGLFITKNLIITHNCGKSYDAAKIVLLWWLANPMGRTGLVASTSLTDLDSRIWGYVKRFHKTLAAVKLPGIFKATPPPKILFDKTDTIHGLFAVPLQRGTAQKTASTLIGRHPDEGFMAIIDEGTDVSPGFMDAVANWEKAQWFQMLVIGNSASMFDPHGLLSRPKNGWDSVDPDYDKEWETKGGICLYFDCYNSPAIHEKDPKKKKLLSKFLFTSQSIAESAEQYGANSPKFQRFTRGFWPSEDSLQTILTAVMVDKFHAKERVQWSGTSPLYKLAGLDPAFNPEGDECVLRFATLGVAQNGLWTLDFGGENNICKLIIDGDSPEPSEYQILRQTVERCEEMGVEPKNIAVDVWGAGSGLGAIFQKNWSHDVYGVASAGPPSKTPVDSEGKELADQVYDRRITELWFSMQLFVQGDQIRGLDDISVEQFCTREYSWKGRKFSIETKGEYKERMGKVDNRYQSPDRADAATMILDLARQFYQFMPERISANSVAEVSLQQKYLNQIRREHLEREHTMEQPVRSGHPSSWDDGFSVSQFDVEENDF